MRIDERECDLFDLPALQGDRQGAVAVITVEVGGDANILDVAFLAGIEVAVAADTRVAEEILVFEIAPVAPAEDLEGDEVFFVPVSGKRSSQTQLRACCLRYIPHSGRLPIHRCSTWPSRNEP